MKLLVIAALTSSALVGLLSNSVAAAVVSIGISDFTAPTIEEFNSAPSSSSFFDFGNGMVYQNLLGHNDMVGYNDIYYMGTEPDVLNGRLGSDDKYFGTLTTPTTFEFAFADGISRFGFFGAESSVADGSDGRNGELNLEFFDLSDILVVQLAVSTLGTFAWDQFHGFQFSDLVGRVVFRDVGHMVLDGVHFESSSVSAVPVPAALPLFGTGIAMMGLVGWWRRRRPTASVARME